MIGVTWKDCGLARPVNVNPPEMSLKSSPNVFPWFLASSISIARILASDTVFVACTMRLPWRPTVRYPGAFRPCPFEFSKPEMGTRHQKIFQNTFFDNTYFLCGNTIVVECIVAIQIDTADALQRRIVNYRTKIRQHRLIYFLGERLSFAFVFLPMAFDAMPEDLVEEH